MKHPNPKLFVVILGDLGDRCFDALDSRFPALQNGAQAFLFASAIGNGVDILNASQWASHRGQEHLAACFDCGDESVALGAACTIARPFTSRGYEIEPVWIRGKIEKPKRIKSFSVVATQEVAQEAAILIASLRTFHADPIFVFCDEDAKALIKSHNFDGVEFKTEADEKTLAAHSDRLAGKVAAKNSFHRVDCIAAKMDAWQWAIDEAGASLFLDADIVAVSNLNGGMRGEVMLSPHYHGGPKLEPARDFGIFNAGYVWSDQPDAPKIWREIYEGKSRFFEQEGMTLFAQHFDVSFYSPDHNVGFWRCPDFDLNVRSWHAHMTDALDEKANNGLRVKYQEHRKRVFDWLEYQGRDDLIDFIECVKK